jgi:hypothetical protein
LARIACRAEKAINASLPILRAASPKNTRTPKCNVKIISFIHKAKTIPKIPLFAQNMWQLVLDFENDAQKLF